MLVLLLIRQHILSALVSRIPPESHQFLYLQIFLACLLVQTTAIAHWHYFFGHTHGRWKFWAQGLNLHHCSDLSHSSDNVGSLIPKPSENSLTGTILKVSLLPLCLPVLHKTRSSLILSPLDTMPSSGYPCDS